ncbi:hypothetical protein GWI33_012285 [Rhynchophorus ferrugineus]|uniref:Uncharacterized protein n=1 Tax=Rhynchophorus ferrugineus TaxID=354439 RepID=A0A834I5M0_RHYFE|nr:hypothetical protein GWI33_012285 [Rhynchophorus ferrugineus]
MQRAQPWQTSNSSRAGSPIHSVQARLRNFSTCLEISSRSGSKQSREIRQAAKGRESTSKWNGRFPVLDSILFIPDKDEIDNSKMYSRTTAIYRRFYVNAK